MVVQTKKYSKCHIVMMELRKLTEMGKLTKNYDKLMRCITPLQFRFVQISGTECD